MTTMNERRSYGFDPAAAESIDRLYAGRSYTDVKFRTEECGRMWSPPVQHIPTYAATAWASVL